MSKKSTANDHDLVSIPPIEPKFTAPEVITAAPKSEGLVESKSDKRTMFLLYDGSYESAFLATKLARDMKNGDPDADFNLTILVPKLGEGDAKVLGQVNKVISQENKAVKFQDINADLGDLSNPDRDKLLACLEAALNEALKAGLKATVLKVTWTTDRINSNKDVYQYILMVKGPILVNKLENSLPENKDAVKDNLPMVRTIGIDWANFGKLHEDIVKLKGNLGLHEIFKEAVISP